MKKYGVMGIVVYPMDLPYIQEPVQIKNKMKQLKVVLCKQSDADCDKMVVWNNNELPKYLWASWSSELRRYGYDWQLFLKVIKLSTGDVVLWALKDALSWDELVKKASKLLITYQGEN
jgi:hypothetical protein